VDTKLAPAAPSASGRLALSLSADPASAAAAALRLSTSTAARHGVLAEQADRAAWLRLLGEPELPAAVLTALVAASCAQEVAQGEQVLSRAEVAQSLMLVVRGDVALGVAQADVPFLPERTVHGPDGLDISSAWLGLPHGLDAVALTPARVLSVPLSSVLQVLQRHPELAARLLTSLARQVHTLSAAAHDLMHKDAEARVAAWMCQRLTPIAHNGSAPRAMVELKERKRDIAAQLGITPETLSRLLRQLSRKALIEVSGYRVTVLDVAALQALAAG
jgi:CRP-like cAMP-binding protein